MDRQEQLIELCKELRLPSTSGSRFNKVSNSKTADVFHLNFPPRSSNSFFVFLYSLIIFFTKLCFVFQSTLWNSLGRENFFIILTNKSFCFILSCFFKFIINIEEVNGVMRSTCGQKINDIFSLLSYFIGNTTKKCYQMITKN